MDLTKDFVKAKSPCADGFRWFLRHHPAGNGYQETLDALVAAGRVEDACWLLAQFGPTNAVLRCDVIEQEALVFAGRIEVRRGIEVGAVLRAGRDVRVGGSLRAGARVQVGGDLDVAGGVRCEALDVAGHVVAGWSLDVAQALRCGGHLRVGGELACGGALACEGALRVREDLGVGASLRCTRGVQVGGALRAGQDVAAIEGILVGAGIDCGRHLEAGWGVKAGADIRAGGAIRAGESVQAGGEIRAGAGYGVFAGLCVPREAWPESARVAASVRPAALVSGWWDDPPALAA